MVDIARDGSETRSPSEISPAPVIDVESVCDPCQESVTLVVFIPKSESPNRKPVIDVPATPSVISEP